MRYTLKTMTLYRWKKLRQKSFVRCEKCSQDIFPNRRYVEAFDDTTPSSTRLLCVMCGESEEKKGSS